MGSTRSQLLPPPLSPVDASLAVLGGLLAVCRRFAGVSLTVRCRFAVGSLVVVRWFSLGGWRFCWCFAGGLLALRCGSLAFHSRYAGGFLAVRWRFAGGSLVVHWRFAFGSLALPFAVSLANRWHSPCVLAKQRIPLPSAPQRGGRLMGGAVKTCTNTRKHASRQGARTTSVRGCRRTRRRKNGL